MALEDCETLVLLLQHCLGEDVENGIARASKAYSDLRRPRLDMVFKKAQQLAGMKQDMNIFQEMLMYLFVWLFSRLKVTEAYECRLNAYDVPTEVQKAIAQGNEYPRSVQSQASKTSLDSNRTRREGTHE